MDSAVVEHHLARLSRDACLAFVADLWAARGFETRVDDDVVVATRRSDEVVIFPACGGRLRSAPMPTRSVDVVVAPTGSATATRVAARHDARLLDASDLREMLRYAVSQTTAAQLCERHLGAAPSALEPSARTRTHRRIDRLRAVELPVDPTVCLVVLVLVVATAGFVAFGGPGPSGGTGSTDLAAEADAAAAAGGDAGVEAGASADTDVATLSPRRADSRRSSGQWRPVTAGSLSSVPGVNTTGVTNLRALAAAHDRALGSQSYTIWADTYRPYNGVPSAERAQRDTDIAVAGDRYLVRESVERGDDRRLVRAVYYDGADWYVDDRSTDERTVRWVDGSRDGASVDPDPRRLRTALVTYYLDTPRSNVTGHAHVDGTTRYRLEGAGTPPPFAVREVYNYEFVAIVGERGFVREATVTYTVVSVEGSYQLRFEWTYDRLNATTVTEPAWVEQARPSADRSTNRTATAQP
jgi:hypothetical protein